jgi:hypothetical protein
MGFNAVGPTDAPDPLAAPPTLRIAVALDSWRVTAEDYDAIWSTLAREERAAILHLAEEACDALRRHWVAVHTRAIRAELTRREAP